MIPAAIKLPKDFVRKLNAVKAKRPATIIQHILRHGHITTEEIKNLYGYNHPPRAVRDVREQGIPIETFRIKDSEGRTIAAYKFGNPEEASNTLGKTAGRTALSKTLKEALIEKYGAKCSVYQETLAPALLQIDHRIPYEIGGEPDGDVENYMLLSPSANRAKSWACEHCVNWQHRDKTFCVGCFWAHPEHYTHIAGRPERKIVLTFTGDEVADYEQLVRKVGIDAAADFVKGLIKKELK